MADDDEIRKIIQATGGGEYNARLGEYCFYFSTRVNRLSLSSEGCFPNEKEGIHSLFLLSGECACEVMLLC